VFFAEHRHFFVICYVQMHIMENQMVLGNGRLVVDVKAENITSIVPKKAKYIALIESEEGVAVLGTLIGDIDSTGGTVFVDEGATVEGAVKGMRVIIAGTVKGDIVAKETVILGHTAHVEGNILYKNLSIEGAAVIEGRVSKIRS
jgi:cytoskeletal protein CcmA (bactofilin family)